jgi:phosphoribosylaminoimidazole-succinocarboxamide synthase
MVGAMERIAEGQSKRVYRRADGRLHIELRPTLYSYTHNRAGEVPGTDRLRLRFMRCVLPRLPAHSYLEVADDHIVAREVPAADRIEVRVKRFHVGTPKHRYHAFAKAEGRFGAVVAADGRYREPFVGFDWRNPMHHPDTGVRLADEVLPDAVADWFLDTATARRTALDTFAALEAFLASAGFVLVDLCFVMSVDGTLVISEVSPDCMRVRDARTGAHFDKQLWRGGDPPEAILAAWTTLCERCEAVA